jgi:Cu(I)/Ag(I) efflux system protein CusF
VIVGATSNPDWSKTMKRTHPFAAAALAAFSLSGAALAQGTPTVTGTVEEVDVAEGKITIDHGPIPNLDMEAMTMEFRARDPALLKDVKAGDRVRFTADRVNGQISVTSIQKGQ